MLFFRYFICHCVLFYRATVLPALWLWGRNWTDHKAKNSFQRSNHLPCPMTGFSKLHQNLVVRFVHSVECPSSGTGPPWLVPDSTLSHWWVECSDMGRDGRMKQGCDWSHRKRSYTLLPNQSAKAFKHKNTTHKLHAAHNTDTDTDTDAHRANALPSLELSHWPTEPAVHMKAQQQ